MASIPVVACRAAFPDYTAICRSTISKKNSKKKAKSKGHLVHHSAGMPPFSAWVEPVKSYEPLAAMENARSEETRMRQVINKREERLKEFQDGVKSRVKELQRLERQQQLGNTYKAIEYERNVVQQSSFPRRIACLAKRDTCVYRDDSELTIKMPLTRASVIHDHKAVDTANQLLEEHADKIRTSTKHARGVLRSKSLPVDEEQLTALPDGLWSVSPTRDCAVSQQSNQVHKEQENWAQNRETLSHMEEKPVSHQEGDYWIGDNEIKDSSLSVNEEKETNERRDSNELPSWIVGQENVTVFKPEVKDKKGKAIQRVRFAGAEIMDGSSNKSVPLRSSISLGSKKAIEDLMKPGKVLEEKKCQSKSQMAVYRRLFMDMEREQVRENIRMKEHRKRMAEVKVEKEIKRLEAEHRQKLIAGAKMSPEKQEISRAEREDIEYQQFLEQRNEKLQRSKETERYIDALRAMLKEKMSKKGIRLPPLCACGPTVWDSSPDTCANNCMFYKNPKAYAKALSSLLGSLGT